MDEVDKWFGIPSIATLILGGTLILYSGSAKTDFKDFCKQASENYPEIAQVNCLEDANCDLKSGDRALTYYMVKPAQYINVGKTTVYSPPIYHYPNTKESQNDLEKARTHTSEVNFYENGEIQIISNRIKGVEIGLDEMKNGKSESVYKPQRAEINGIEQRAEIELTRLRNKVPKDVMSKRDNLKSKYVISSATGWVLGILGGVCSAVYGLFKILDDSY